MQLKKSLKDLYYSKQNYDEDLEKTGLKDKIKAGIVAGSSLLFNPSVQNQTQQPVQPKIEQPTTPPDTKPVFGEEHILGEARKAGLHGKELAAFMAQIAHETMNFKKPKEIISDNIANKRYKGGKNFLGRGYIHLTHDYNYKKYGQMIGVDLYNNPHLASDPDIAAQVALKYWETQVRPKVKNWDNVFEHSRAINKPAAKSPAEINGFLDRQLKYNTYKPKFLNQPKIKIAEKSIQNYINEALQKSLEEVQTQSIQNIVNEVLQKSLEEIKKN